MAYKIIQDTTGNCALDDESIETSLSFGSVTQPASGSTSVKVTRALGFIKLVITFLKSRVTVTDGGGSGSHGSYTFFTFPQGAISFLGCRQNYTAFAEGAALTGGAGDASFEIGIGTTAISAAAEKTLGNGVNENVGQAVIVTLSGGTGTGTAVDGADTTALDGTSTALSLKLNWSGSAATIDANSTIDVTGTVTVVCAYLGDD